MKLQQPNEQEKKYLAQLSRIIVLGMGLTVIDVARKLISGDTVGPSGTLLSVLGNLILAFYIQWLQGKWKLKRGGLVLLLWINLFIVGSFSNMVEGYFFTDVFNPPGMFIAGSIIMLVFSGLQATVSSYLVPLGERNLQASFVSFVKRRSIGDWAKRVLAGTLIYFPVYFFFGMLVSPFVMPYYSDPSMGLVIPPLTVIIPLEIFRGFLYVTVLLPVAACMDAERRTTALGLMGMLFIPGAFLPLLAYQGLPPAIIPFHLLEIFADSVVYGYVLARMLS